jgi:hypothetical protein
MIDKMWEFFASDDRTDKLIMRIATVAFSVGVFFAVVYITPLILIGVGIIILGVVFIKLITDRAQRKADEEWREILYSEDDGVTGYIKVTPEQLEAGLPWVLKPKNKPPDTLPPHITKNEHREQSP